MNRTVTDVSVAQGNKDEDVRKLNMSTIQTFEKTAVAMFIASIFNATNSGPFASQICSPYAI
jgi:hypothetical protein